MGEIDITKKEKQDQTFKDKLIINFYDFASVLATAIVTIMIIFTFLFRVVGVEGTSMLQTLQDDDWLIISAYNHKPEYGQVVIITQPNWFNEPIVKRIIATENQTVDIDFDTGAVYVDGQELDEPYINNLTLNKSEVDFPLTVPEGHVFVMGDNRQGSSDSRSDKIGFIREEYILGVAKLRPINYDAAAYGNSKKLSFYPISEWKIEKAELKTK